MISGEFSDLSTDPLKIGAIATGTSLSLFAAKVLGSSYNHNKYVINRIAPDTQRGARDFNQKSLIEYLNDTFKYDPDCYPELHRIAKKYNGLCEIICNFMFDKMGKEYSVYEGLRDVIKLQNINDFKDTHILENYSFSQKMKSIFQSIYPNNLLDQAKQDRIVVKNQNYSEESPFLNVLDENLFMNFLNKNVQVNQTIRTRVFGKLSLNFGAGHSVLFRKTGDNEFTFFDPNYGLWNKNSSQELMTLLNLTMHEFNSTQIYFSA